MLISELSMKTGVSIYTIRFYENKGLIEGTPDENVKTNKYKKYDESQFGCNFFDVDLWGE